MTRQPLTFTTAAIVASPALAAETVIATLAGVTCQFAGDTFKLHGYVNISPGTSGVDAILRIRRGAVGGTLVAGPAGIPGGVTAGAGAVSNTIDGVDTPGDVANATYVLTVQVTSAGAASTVNGVTLNARCD